MASNAQQYDLLILTDATASMSTYLRSLNASLPEIIRISALTDCFARIGVLAYRDYCAGILTEWSGWYAGDDMASGDEFITQQRLLDFAQRLNANNGGDWPEATKTGLAHAYQVMRADATTFMLLYTDAPPHMPCTGGANRQRERADLSRPKSFGGYGPLFVDWVTGSRALATGEKKAKVFALVNSHLVDTLSPYIYLCHLTGGACFRLHDNSSSVISSHTMTLLLGWMGVGKAGAASANFIISRLQRYKSADTIDKIANEDDNVMEKYFLKKDHKSFEKLVRDNVDVVDVKLDTIKDFITPRDPPLLDFSKKYIANAKYRSLVVTQLRYIIDNDVKAMTLNPVFGSLWRTVCNDRENDARDSLIQAFGLQVDRISDVEQKKRMKAWLEESYNYEAEILGLIEAVPAEEKFPCVFLDPTQDFTPPPSANDTDDADKRPINQFTREELLEIGRSCDYRVLRRLGKVLTRLTYVDSADKLPAHIQKMTEAEVPKMPLALVQSKHKAKFWKLLLHVVLPGTMLSTRPAAVLAALSLRMGMQPLQAAADAELLAYSGKWNTLDIPETWNVGCLSLLLDADRDFESRVQNGSRARPEVGAQGVLAAEERGLFRTLVDYKLLELNMNTTLQARIGWHPEKTKVAMGPVVICKRCQFPRSVTLMGQDGICGLCTRCPCPCDTCDHPESYAQRINNNVAKDDNERTEATWVECVVADCRAQYVVYNPDALRVRAKCFYCRQAGTQRAKIGAAPTVECVQCLSRVIWPYDYRPDDLKEDEFKCPACETSKVTIITQETSAQQLRGENGTQWLLRNDDNSIPEPFNGRTLFYTASHVVDLKTLENNVAVLPASAQDSTLTIRGKLVRNLPEVHESLRQWVLARRTEAGVCSLCFSDLRKSDLRSACGRTGCQQKICAGCTRDWYGLNGAGRIINVAALQCPFCRRQPAAKTVREFGIAQLGQLRDAVNDAGTWIYAWCGGGCGSAKRFAERVCAAGAPPELSGWQCDDCRATAGTPTVKIKKCPGCKSPTEKMSGCDHITCPVCDAHWCFFCGKKETADTIYTHMNDAHGGYWAGEQDYED